MQALLGLGVDGPEAATREISTEAVVGVVRWAQDQNKKGHTPFAGVIVKKLMNGGLAGYGELREASETWHRTYLGREKWIEANVPELDPDYAETAVISLLQDKRDPTAESVRQRAQELQHDQQAHDEDCKRSLAGRDRGGAVAPAVSPDKSAGTPSTQAHGGQASRPASEQKAA